MTLDDSRLPHGKMRGQGALMIGQSLGRYTIESKPGEGGMGIVIYDIGSDGATNFIVPCC